MNKAEFVAKIAAITTAAIAVVVFAIGIFDDQETRHQARVDNWRKAEIQKIFHDQQDGALTFSDLTKELRSSAMDDADVDIESTDLSDRKVRILLAELIASGILHQTQTNTYALDFLAKDTSLSIGNVAELSEALVDAIKGEVARTMPSAIQESMLPVLQEVAQREITRILSETSEGQVNLGLGLSETTREIHYLGEVACDAETTFRVPDPDTSTTDWIVFGIDPYINTVFDPKGDNPNNNALLGFRSTIVATANEKAWKAGFSVRVNFGTNGEKDIGDCNRHQNGRLLEGDRSKIHFVAIRKNN